MLIPLTPDDPLELGAFRLAGRLGEGGQGVVYLAHDRMGRPVAVKLLSSGDPETRARLARELSALESVASFCTAAVLTASAEGRRPYVVSEYIEGPSLHERVRDRGPLSGGELERLFVGTATALAAIHAAGVVHRDFKPSNVLLGPDGPRVVDFGIARAEGASTMTSGLVGTPAYLAPEQIGGSPASFASDVFAWAATMVFAASARAPFGADTVPAVLHRVLHAEPDLSALPPRLRDVVAAALAKDPAVRPTARTLMVALVDPQAGPVSPASLFRGGSAPASPGDTDPGRAAMTTRGGARRGRRTLVVGSALAVAALTAGAVVVVNLPGLRPGQGERPTPTSSTGSVTAPPSTKSPTATVTATSAASASSSPAGELKIPAAFAGRWSGHTTTTNPMDPDGAENTVEIRAGAASASWTEKDAQVDCEEEIRLTKVEKSKLTFALTQDSGCVAGTIELTLGDGVLRYLWRDVPGLGLVEQSGDLRRS
ncbi:protein kinase domain-containing protein [Nonomuraea dietziae]|uniref:protein kinase domain-containing protein n=1 Tax=Nonomuraea dietziae TaxID=65515 RepID=UPI0033EB832B